MVSNLYLILYKKFKNRFNTKNILSVFKKINGLFIKAVVEQKIYNDNLCIIPARKGSKGIKNKKYVVNFLGKTLNSTYFRYCKKNQKNNFDILVSTDLHIKKN